MRFVLFSGESSHGVQERHIQSLSRAFKHMGHEVFVLDFVAGGTTEIMQEAITEQIHGFFAFNAVGSDALMGDSSLFEMLDSVYVTCLLDHPAFHWEKLTTNLNKFAVLSADHEHVRFLQRHFAADHFSALGFLPPGGETELDDTAFDKWLDDRDIEILFSGSLHGSSQRSWREYGENRLSALLDAAVDIALDGETVPFDDALDSAIQELPFSLAPKHRTWLAMNTPLAHQYIETSRRLQLLESLHEADIPVTVVGDGWEPHQERFAAFDFQGTKSAVEAAALMRKSRWVLNSNNHCLAGAHERVFVAQACGAAILSDASSFYLSEYEEGQDILLYRWNALHEIPALVQKYRNAPEQLVAIAQNGWCQLCAKHSWADRAQKIVELCELIGALN